MPDIYEIADDLGIDQPDNTVDEKEVDSDDFLVNSAMEDKINELFNHEATSKEQPNVEKVEEPKKEETVTTDDDQKKTDQKPLSFEEASKNAFFNTDGEIDTEKVSSYFLDKGNSVDFSTIQDDPLDNIKEPGTMETPDEKYYKDVSGIVESLPDILQKEQENGFTPEQTIQRLINTFNGFNSEREARKGLLNERNELSKQFKDELNHIREEKLMTRIRANTSELGSHYDKLIPGVKGTDVLNSFMLEKKFGGKMLDTLFRRDNPGFDKLSVDEQKATTEKWFKNFQANKREMAMVAEFGRAQWVLERLPEIIQHSQKIGATKKNNEKESQIGRPSVINKNSRGGSSGLDEFFGYDSVN